jgi:hypothetical protein
MEKEFIMGLYFLTYDLRKVRDYPKIMKELKEIWGAVEILESTYCFHSYNNKAEYICNHFRKFIDNDDGLIVSKVSEWKAFNTDDTPDNLI